jgi:hypothetical protein
LSRRRPGPETVARLKRIVDGRQVSLNSMIVLSQVLGELGHTVDQPLLDKSILEVEGSILDTAGYRDADRALLEAVLKACRVAASPSAEPRKLAAIGALIWGPGLPELEAPSWYVLRRRIDSDAVDAVLRGTIHALSLDERELAEDAAWCLARIDENPQHSLLRLVPTVDIEPVWERATELDLPVQDVTRGIEHQSMVVAYLAANLIEAGVGGNEAGDRLEVTLAHGHDQSLRVIASCAEHIWGSRAKDVIIARLQADLWFGCRWLYHVLPSLPGAKSDARFLPTLLRGLDTADSTVAAEAAAGLAQMDRTELMSIGADLHAAFNRWTDLGAWCWRCETYTKGGSCPTCHIVPESPRADLLRVLARMEIFEVDRLIAFDSDSRHDVRDAAMEALTQALSSRPGQLKRIVGGLTRGDYSERVVDSVMAVPVELLGKVWDDLLRLLESPSAPVSITATVSW